MSDDLYPVKPHIAERAHIRTHGGVPAALPALARRPRVVLGASRRRRSPGSTRGSRVLRRRLRRGRLRLVLRRPAQRLLQLRRPAPAATLRRPDRDHLGRGRARRLPPHHLPRAEAQRLRASPTCCSPTASRKGDRVCIYMPMIPELVVHDARLRAHRRGALGGLRRLLGRVAARPHPRRAAARWW